MPKQKKLSSLERFNNDLAENKDGWAWHYPENQFDRDDSMWEFRISLAPNSKNLKKAAQLLGPIFAREGLEFKFLLLDGSEDVNSIDWDATQAKLNGSSDRDQRGKECCVYVRIPEKSDRYEKTPEELKTLMLKAWKLLQKNNIQYGYVSAPNGDRAIPAEGGLVSPFSYASNRPWKGSHGILLPEVYKKEARDLLQNKTTSYEGYLDLAKSNPDPRTLKSIDYNDLPDHNPLLFVDPFKNIEFTPEDLLKNDIEIGEVLQAQYQRTQYQKNHIADAKQKLASFQQEIINSTEGKTSIALSFNNFMDSLNGAETDVAKLDYIKENKEKLLWICDHWPRVPGGTLSMYAKVENIKYYLEHIDSEQNAVKEIEDNLNTMQTHNVVYLIHDIKFDFADYLKEIDQKEINELIEKDPANAQLLFRRMIHIRNEERAYQAEMQRMNQHAALIPIHESIVLLDRDNKPQEKLRGELIKLQGELFQKMHDKNGLSDASKQDITVIAQGVKTMTQDILNKDNNKEIKINCVKHFEQSVHILQSFKKPAWKNVGKAVACVLLAAVGAALGAVIGAVVEGAILAALSAPGGGVAGVFGVIHGAIHGSITGWAVGLMAASALGLTAGTGIGIRFIGKDRIDTVTQAADKIAATPALPKLIS